MQIQATCPRLSALNRAFALYLLLLLSIAPLAAQTALGPQEPDVTFTQSGLTLTPHAASAIIPTDRHLFGSITVANTSDADIEMPFQIRCLDTDQEIPSFPQPPTLYLSPDETQTISFFLDENHGRLNEDNLDLGANTRTLRFSFIPRFGAGEGFDFELTYDIDYFDRESPPNTVPYTGTVVDPNDLPIAGASLQLYTAGIQFMGSTNEQGQFSIDYPANDASDFRIRIEAPGYEAFSSLTVQSDSGSTFQLQPLELNQVPVGTLVKSVSGDIGFWRGIPSESAQTILFTNGMENWNGPDGDTYQSYHPDASLFLYSIAPETFGEQLWFYNLGQEAWGASLSPDGAYAAVVTTGPAGSRTLDPGILTVLDASDGSKLWDGNIETLYGASDSGNRLGSFCVQISNTSENRLLAMGTGAGDLLIIDLLTGNEVRRVFLEGQIREVRFDDTDTYLYAGSGSGHLYKIEVATGNIEWAAYVHGWPFVNGLEFSKDGNWIGVGSKNFFISLVNRSTGEVAWSRRMRGTVHAVGISPDSSIAIGASGGLTTAYSVATGEELWTLPRNGHKVIWLDDGSFVLIDESFVTPGGTSVSSLGIQVPGQSAQYNYMDGQGTIAVAAARDVAPGSDVLQFVTIALQDYVSNQDPGEEDPGDNPPQPVGFTIDFEPISFDRESPAFELRFPINRDALFQIELSNDLSTWTPLGEQIQGAPETQDDWIQQIDHSIQNALYIRIHETLPPPK